MNLRDIHYTKRGVLTTIGIILFAIFLIFIAYPAFKQKPIVASIDENQLSPGDEALMEVKISNFGDFNIGNVTVFASTADPNIKLIGPTPESCPIGKREIRIFKFNVKIAETATEGKYIIQLSSPKLDEVAEINLWVKEK